MTPSFSSNPSTPPLVSIVLPTYNRASYLAGAIRSVLKQSYSHWELIITDNGSVDETPKIIASFSDPRIRSVRQTQNLGAVANWSAGFNMAQGEFLAFLSDDDRLAPRFIANHLARLKSDPALAVVFSRYEVRSANGDLISVKNSDWERELRCGPTELLRYALAKSWFVGASLYRRQVMCAVWEEAAKEAIAFDLSLNIRLAIGGAHGILSPDQDLIYTEHPGQVSEAQREVVFAQTTEALERILRGPVPPESASFIREELASWTLLAGRYSAGLEKISTSCHYFLKSVRARPYSLNGWKHLAAAWLQPGRLARSAKKQWARTPPK